MASEGYLEEIVGTVNDILMLPLAHCGPRRHDWVVHDGPVRAAHDERSHHVGSVPIRVCKSSPDHLVRGDNLCMPADRGYAAAR
jgi:hypothetical protein